VWHISPSGTTDPVFTVAPPASLTDSAHEAIAASIYSGAMAPGSRIVIDQVATALSMSISPVREALMRLAAEGLVTFEANRGYTVAPHLGEVEFDQLFRARRLLECGAFDGRDRMSWSDLEVERVSRAMDAANAASIGPDYPAYSAFSRADHAFHEAVIELSGNRFIHSAWRGLNFHLHISRLYEAHGVVDYASAVDEHAVILAAVRSGDLPALTAAIAAHIDNAAVRLRALLSDPAGSAAQ